MDEKTAREKIDGIAEWLAYVDAECEAERISYSELAQVDEVYDLIENIE